MLYNSLAMNFKLVSDFRPTGDQPQAIEALLKALKRGVKTQELLGVTGSGKTFTMANIIKRYKKPTLVISHNKTLAAQLYQEFRDFFSKNAVGYFVSYYDYYQPEAYIPQTDTYIEKETDINEEIDKLRLSATTNLLTRKDVIIVASVSCIYNIGSPIEYGRYILELKSDQKIGQKQILNRLIDLQYTRKDMEFSRGTFRVRGDNIEVWPAYEDHGLRIQLLEDRIQKLENFDPITGKAEPIKARANNLKPTTYIIYPAKHYMTNPNTLKDTFITIRKDLKDRLKKLKKQGKELEAHRLEQRVNYDLEMISEFGYVNGIENYSRYFDGRQPGEPPYTLLDYFRESDPNFLTFIDESHITIPQLRGMYEGDKSRKQTLIEYGFRLPAALDNRPLKFDEFLTRIPQLIGTSATPGPWEQSQSSQTIEQLIRPTGLLDPEIEIRPTKNQIDNLIEEIENRVNHGERTLVTTLTKRMAEALSDYLENKGIKVHYLHSDVDTLDRSDILDNLRLGKYDVVVGINLLREGLDLPEVSLIAILDADKEGFLRSETSLIQTMGRAARHVRGKVIMYADKTTGSMSRAINEVSRRRNIQLDYNRKHKIKPRSIKKPIREKLIQRDEKESPRTTVIQLTKKQAVDLADVDPDALTPKDKKKLIRGLTRRMNLAARDLDFELAAKIRDTISLLTSH
jgi:excinuclease ABC subunit B